MSSLIEAEPRYGNVSRDETIVLRARLSALELLIELLLADRMERVPNPVDGALAFKREVLGLVAVTDPGLREEDRRLHDMAVAFLDQRLSSTVGRVAFDDSTSQPNVKRATG